MPWNADPAFGGILLLLLCALLATWVKPSRGISARNPQVLDLKPAPCMRQGCRQAAKWKRARHSRRATKTVGMKISRCRPTLSAPVPFVFHPMGAATQVPTCQAQHWLHVYRCSQTRLKAYSCSPGQASGANMQVPTGQAPGAQVPQTWLRACRCPQARLQVQPCRYPQAMLQVQTCRCLPQARLQVCRCQQARLQVYTC